MSDDPWYKSKEPCPLCDDYYHIANSGVPQEGQESTLETPTVERVCVQGPDEDHDHPCIYFHTAALLGGDDDGE